VIAIRLVFDRSRLGQITRPAAVATSYVTSLGSAPDRLAIATPADQGDQCRHQRARSTLAAWPARLAHRGGLPGIPDRSQAKSTVIARQTGR